MPALPLVSGSILPAALLCKNRGKVETLLGNYCWSTAFNIVFRGYCLHTDSSPFICPSISTWRKSAILETTEQKFLPAWNSCCKLSYILTCKNPSKVTPVTLFFVAYVTMLNRIKIAPRRSSPQGLKWKMSLGHRPNSPHTIYHCQAGNSSPFYSLLLLFTPFDSLLSLILPSAY